MLQNEIDELALMEKNNPGDLIRELINNQLRIKTNYNLYYDDKEDTSWIKQYYSNISNHLPKEQLFNFYHELITKTHHDKYPYYISKDKFLYTWVDLHPNGQLKSIYSGKRKDPQQSITEDFETIKKRFVRYQYIRKIDQFSDKQMVDQLRMVSKQHKYNTEHVVPLSWFQSKEPMKGDLHHLFACEPICNSLRSNYPYYEYNSEQSPSHIRNNCGKYDMNRFEPFYGKGVVARAMLYFLLRYPKKITTRFRKIIDIPLLIKWHEQFQVTTYEKHRNKAIFEIQGNRNPFIDFPNIVNDISFSLDD